MTEQQAITLFKCLADKSRIQILKSLMEEEISMQKQRDEAYRKKVIDSFLNMAN